MKKILATLLFTAFAMAEGICGYYLLEKNDEGKEAVAEVFEKDGKYYAYGIINSDGTYSQDVNNPDDKLKGRSLKGVVFMWGLEKDGDEWDDGKIYNTSNGKTYSASAKLEGDILKVKATFWGIGKTLVWKKVSEEQIAPLLANKPTMEEVLSTIPTK